MLKHYRKLFFAIFLIYLFLAGASARAEEGKAYKTTLDNGLKVIIEEVHSAPVVSIQMWVKVGSGDETENIGGISHVFEHMLFKGTEQRKVGQIANIIESVGGDINAFTSFDNTTFHLTVPSRNFSTGLDIISDAIQHSSFDPVELKKELEVVLEELRMNEDNPSRKLYKTLLSTGYTTHPYKRPVIGYQDVVSSFTRDEIISFFKKWYIPNNMTLVIVGDIDTDAALKEVKKEFKEFKHAENPHKDRPIEPPQNGIKTGIIIKQVKEPHVGLAFHIPEIKNPDTYAIDVASAVLAGGESSRLYKKLKIEQSVVDAVSAYPMSLADPGMFFVTETLEAKNIDGALSDTIMEIKRLGFEGPNHEEIQKAKFNLESDFVYSRETMDGIADKLGYYETIPGNFNYEKEYLDGIKKVTPDDVKRVINKYLIESNMSAAAIIPSSDKDTITGEYLARTIEGAGKKAQKEFVKKEAGEKITKVRLDNGITLIVKEAHANPTVAFYATFPGGLRFEESKNNGIGNFTAQMLTRGSKKRTREELSRDIDEMAGDISGFSGWNSTGVSAKFLSMFFDKGLDIFADVIMNPAFPEKEIIKLKKEDISAINRQEDNLPSYTFKLLYRSLYKVHPYGMPVIGTVDTVSSFKGDDLMGHYNGFFVPERMVLAIVGDINRDYAIERVKALFNDFKRTSKPLPEPPAEAGLTSIRETGAVKEAEQTNIGIGFLGTTIGSEDSYPLKVMTEVLSGQGGRLFLDLRDRQSLAYSVSAFSKEGKDPGMFAIYIGGAPGKKDAAIAGILKELNDIKTGKVTDEELNRGKSAIIGGYEIGLQEVSSQASDMANNELLGLGYNFNKILPGRIQAVTQDDILRVAKKYLTLDAYTISVVGPNGNGKGLK